MDIGPNSQFALLHSIFVSFYRRGVLLYGTTANCVSTVLTVNFANGYEQTEKVKFSPLCSVLKTMRSTNEDDGLNTDLNVIIYYLLINPSDWTELSFHDYFLAFRFDDLSSERDLISILLGAICVDRS